MEELLFSQDYQAGETVTFSLYRSQEGENVTISLRYRFQVPGAEEITCKRIFYPACAEEYQSPYLSWYNLICCSNNYGPIPVVSYMNYAVQNGKKVAATIYPETAELYMQIIAEAGDNSCYPFNTQEYQYMLYYSLPGKLKDYFDIDRILTVYQKSGVSLDEEKFREYCSQDLSWFGREECPIELQNCLGDEELATVGLLFGYPVESTVALIRKTIDMCE